MDYKKIEACLKTDYMIGIEIMKFTRHKWHVGGSCPKDAKVVNPKDEWGARGVGGTYPYLLPSSTIFLRENGFGCIWDPTKNISQAFMVAEKIKLFSKASLDAFYSMYRISGFHKDGGEHLIATAESAALAICRAALVLWSEPKKKVS